MPCLKVAVGYGQYRNAVASVRRGPINIQEYRTLEAHPTLPRCGLAPYF
jgi:hypothetical protein